MRCATLKSNVPNHLGTWAGNVVRAAAALHSQLLANVLRAPTSFFGQLTVHHAMLPLALTPRTSAFTAPFTSFACHLDRPDTNGANLEPV